MSELRELLEHVRERVKGLSPSHYAFLEALVEELEAQRPPEVDARIAKLTDERDSWERQCRNAERGLIEAKAEIERLRQKCQYMGRCVAQAEIARLRPLATIGELVRGMRDDTGLTFMAGQYCARRCAFPPPRHWLRLYRIEGTDSANPAEALRSIQASE